MLYKCEALTNFNLKDFKTKKVEKMDQTFGYCKNLYTLDIRNFESKSLGKDFSLFLGMEEEGIIIYSPNLFNDTYINNSPIKDWERVEIP